MAVSDGARLLSDLRQAGVIPVIEGERVAFDLPASGIPLALRAHLQANREAVRAAALEWEAERVWLADHIVSLAERMNGLHLTRDWPREQWREHTDRIRRDDQRLTAALTRREETLASYGWEIDASGRWVHKDGSTVFPVPPAGDVVVGEVCRWIGAHVPAGAILWAGEHAPALGEEIAAKEATFGEAASGEDEAALKLAVVALAQAYRALLAAYRATVGAPVTVTEAPAAGSRVPVLVTEPAQIPAVLAALEGARRIALDLETTGLSPRQDRARLLCLATDAGTFVVDLFRVRPDPLFPLLAARPLVAHHALFDLSFLRALGFGPGAVTDTILLARLLGAGLPEQKGFYSLAGVVERELGLVLEKELQRSDWSGALSRAQWEYAARDAGVLLPLADALTVKIEGAGLATAAAIESRCLPAMVWMSAAGAPFDRAAWEALAGEAESEAARLEGALDAMAPARPSPHPLLGLGGEFDLRWKWGSPQQCLAALAAAGFRLEDTSDDSLAACAAPFPELLRQYREQAKLVDGYGRGWLARDEGGRIYPDWLQMGSAAGRMACRAPNLQQVPRDPRYRACIAAPEGRVLVKADYAQIELRLAARIAGEPVMLAAYQRGDDLHALTARSILGQEVATKQDRQLAKAVNFGLLYGMGAARFRTYAFVQFGVALSEEDAAGYRRAFFRLYPGLARWHRRQKDGIEATRTLSGRRRLNVEAFTWKLNSPVQGTGADGLKCALALLWERRGECPGAVPVIACHDEIVVECDAGEAAPVAAWLARAMKDGMAALAAPVPVEVEVQVARTWAG